MNKEKLKPNLVFIFLIRCGDEITREAFNSGMKWVNRN